MVELSHKVRALDVPYTIRFRGVTEERFLELMDEDTKGELLGSDMIVHSPASLQHDRLTGFLRALMRCYTEEQGLGEVLGPDGLIHLAPQQFFAPDVFFVARGRIAAPLLQKQFEGAPELVVEVLSPSNRNEDLNEKRPAYQEAGVGEIWIVDVDERQVIIDRRRRRRYVSEKVASGRVASVVLPGFWVEAAWLWAEPLPTVITCLHEILS